MNACSLTQTWKSFDCNHRDLISAWVKLSNNRLKFVLALKQRKKELLLLNFRLKPQNFQLGSFMKKLRRVSPVTAVRRMAVNLTWNSVDSDLPLGKSFRVCFKVVLYRDCAQWQEIASH
jgi:hypothetical protein